MLAAWKTSSTASASGESRSMSAGDAGVDVAQLLGEREPLAGGEHAHLDEAVAAPVALDDAVAGAQRAGVDAEDDHALRGLAGGRGLHLLLGDVEVVPDVLHVFVVVERPR